MQRTDTTIANCGHVVRFPVTIGADGTEADNIPFACLECEAAAEAEGEEYQARGEAAAHIPAAWG